MLYNKKNLYSVGRFMLNYKIANLSEVDEQFHSLYEEKDGAYFLKVSGVVAESDLEGIKANRDALLAEKKEQQRKAEEAEAERLRIEREALEEAARQKGDWQALEDSYKAKLAERETDFANQADALRKQVYKLTVGEQAIKLAAELSKPHAQAIMSRFIEERLTLDENNNIRVLDSQGKPSAMTIDDLKAEFKANAMFQDIVVVNNSTGSGATGGLGGGADKNPKDMTEQERRDLKAKNPELFKQLFLNK